MLRNKNLIPLSHQHQHALALCVRIDRASEAGELDLLAFQTEIQQLFVGEIQNHFEAEERELFPLALRFPELGKLVDDLLHEHALLRDYFALATEMSMDPGKLHAFAKKLSAHIRKEERQLFESLQRVLSPQEMASLGAALASTLSESTPDSASCAIPSPATRLRPRRATGK